MNTVACVYKSGTFMNRHNAVNYSPAHVRWLRDQVARNLTIPHRFVCLSDTEVEGVETIPLRHNWPGWWSKIELFRAGLFTGQVFYLDLDMVIVKDITPMVEYRHKFSILRNLSVVHNPGREKSSGRLGSAIMAWRAGKQDQVYEMFKINPERHMEKYVTPARWGDQGFLQDHLNKWDYIQDQFPGAVVSYKIDMKQEGKPPKDCRIVAFHGEPKPFELQRKHPWIPAI